MPPSTELDPRVVRTRRHVLAAARTVLVEEGWERVTVTRVADRSGYARTSLYRQWPQRLDLLRDLITDEVHLLPRLPPAMSELIWWPSSRPSGWRSQRRAWAG